jgi:choline dehydrogenase-like flavoprotein
VCRDRSSDRSLSNKYEDIKDRYDAIVIGSGAGGAIVAWRLSQRGIRVALFEAGPEPNSLREDHPVIKAVKYYWDNGLTFTMGKPSISLPFGRVLGGTVTVNSGTMFRVSEETLSKWSIETGVNIDRGRLGEAYSLVENKLNVRDVPDELLGNNANVVKKGAEELGLNHYPVKRPIGECCGAGECAFGCPYDGKIDMRISFLSEAKRYGLEIYSNSPVKYIVKRGNRVKGVVVNIDGYEKMVEADIVIVSAGALNTPHLLRKAGVDNENLGRHLHIHPAVGVTAFMKYKVFGWRGTMQSYCIDDLFSDWHTLLLATFPPPGIGYSAGSVPLDSLDKYPYLASIGVQSSDDGEGHIPSLRLLGVAKYNLWDDDLEKIKEGIILATEILLAAGAEKIFLPIKKTLGIESVSEARKILNEASIEYFKLSAYHPMSTARMGSDEEEGVVDDRGRVFGYENLYVADASIIPSSTHVNPQLTINALSLMVADNILNDIGVGV